MQIFDSEKTLEKEILASLHSETTISASIKEKSDIKAEADKFVKFYMDYKGMPKEAMASIETVATTEDELLTNHPYLLCGECILVSTLMNGNDDIFIPEETWAARFTPIGTPFNNKHEKKTIIGHTYDSYILAENKKTVIDIKSTEIPDFFHIANKFALYDKIFPALAEDISKKGPEHRLFVSMEATIENFDFGLISADDTLKIVKRNNETAFLTKYLRVFGGEGVYNGERLGRVLRGIVFSGMGNVDSPANPDSEYLVIKGKIMATEVKDMTKELEQKSAELTVANETVKTLTEQLATITKEKAASDEGAKEASAKLAAATEQVKTLETSVATVTKEATDLKTSVDELTKTLTAKTAELAAKIAELETIKAKEIATARLAKFVEIGADTTKKDELLKKFETMTEAQFADMVELFKSIKPVVAEKTKEVEKIETEAEKTVDPEKIADPNKSETVKDVAASLVKHLNSNKADKKSKIDKK